MASPASTATLAAESIDGDRSMDLDDDSGGEPEHNDFDADDEFTQGIVGGSEYSDQDDDSPLPLSALMLAAGNPDARILHAMLQERNVLHGTKTRAASERRQRLGTPESPSPASRSNSGLWPNTYRYGQNWVGITTPLLEAIRAGLPENVENLLDAKANPNGPPLWLMENYSAFFLRFRPIIPEFSDCCGDVATRQALLERMDLPQISTLTWEEVEDRFWDGMAPFWCEQDFVPADFYPYGEAMPAIVEAARCGDSDILDQLVEAGADTSFWLRPQFFVPDPPTESSLSVSSPIHAALQANDHEMLDYLLELGFEPNTMPLSNPTRCFTPLMAIVIQHKDFDYQAFYTLAHRPNINFELRTPVYSVHLLHFAVATLDLEIIQHITQFTPLRNAGVTALGHTLLHIACMPANALEVQRYSEVVYNSIHETRDLHAHNDPYASRPPKIGPCESSGTNFDEQIAVVKFLLKNDIDDVQKTDVHGNTALHYLGGYRYANLELIEWWLEQHGVEDVFKKSLNMYGATAEQLLHESRSAQARELPGGNTQPWFDRTRKKERVAKKQAIWKRLLGNEAKRDL